MSRRLSGSKQSVPTWVLFGGGGEELCAAAASPPAGTVGEEPESSAPAVWFDFYADFAPSSRWRLRLVSAAASSAPPSLGDTAKATETSSLFGSTRRSRAADVPLFSGNGGKLTKVEYPYSKNNKYSLEETERKS